MRHLHPPAPRQPSAGPCSPCDGPVVPWTRGPRHPCMDACRPSQCGRRATEGMAPGIPSPHSTGRHGSPGWTLPRGDCDRPHVLLAPQELWDPPQRVVVPEDPALRRGCGGVLPRHPPVPGVPRPHPLAAGQCLHGGAVHGVGGPHRQGTLDQPCLRLPVRLMALCRLQRIHHRPGGTPGTRGLATGGPHTGVLQYGPRPRSPPPSLFAYHRHLARRPAGPGG